MNPLELLSTPYAIAYAIYSGKYSSVPGDAEDFKLAEKALLEHTARIWGDNVRDDVENKAAVMVAVLENNSLISAVAGINRDTYEIFRQCKDAFVCNF